MITAVIKTTVYNHDLLSLSLCVTDAMVCPRLIATRASPATTGTVAKVYPDDKSFLAHGDGGDPGKERSGQVGKMGQCWITPRGWAKCQVIVLYIYCKEPFYCGRIWKSIHYFRIRQETQYTFLFILHYYSNWEFVYLWSLEAFQAFQVKGLNYFLVIYNMNIELSVLFFFYLTFQRSV